MAQVSVVDDVITALLATIRAAVTVPVYDGLEVTSAADPDFVIVGNDGSRDADDEQPAATVRQDLAAFEQGSRDETGDVVCAVISQGGEMDLVARRAATRVLMVAIEAALRTDDTLGGVVAQGGITSIELHQPRSRAGAEVRRAFTYSYMAFQG